MAVITKIIEQYRKLIGFCDRFWQAVAQECGPEIRCRPGCSDCCQLEGVSALEAHVLQVVWQDRAGGDHLPVSPARCVFLAAGHCLVYEARPIICRTHGLPITGQDLTGGTVDCCPLNFSPSSLATLDRHLVLDVDLLTANLMRLNLAFCLLLGDRDLAGERIALSDIRAGRVPDIVAKTTFRQEGA